MTGSGVEGEGPQMEFNTSPCKTERKHCQEEKGQERMR